MPIDFLRTSGIIIPREYEIYPFYNDVKDHLTRKSKDYHKPTYTTNCYFIEGPKFLKVPRFFPINEYCNYFNLTEKINPGKDIKINHNITLRDELQRNIVEYMLSHNNGIIQANPGSGKTVVSIYAISEIKKKTLILVHRNNLMEQWIGPGTADKKQGFLSYTDISSDEIDILRSSNYEKILKKSIIVCTDQTFTSLLRNKRDSFLKALNEAEIGLFIADEVHTSVGAPTFAECSIHVPSKIVFGLSATPSRWDGTSDIMTYHLGKVFIPEGTSSTMDARVTVLLFNFGFLPKSFKYIYWNDVFQRPRYLTILKNSKIFMSITKTLIDKFIQENRKIIYMGERIKLLEILYSNKSWVDKGLFAGTADLKPIENQLTFATPGKMRDGIDAVNKDCLILSSPISNIEQMCGRVL